MKFKVIGPRRVAGAARGELVDLDPARADIAALVEAGHIEPYTPPPAPPAPCGGRKSGERDGKGAGR